MNEMDIRSYREMLLKKSSEIRYEAQHSKIAADKAEAIRAKLDPAKVEKLKELGIDMDFIMKVDLNLMQTDKQYYSQIKSKSDLEYGKLSQIITEGVGKIESSI